MICEDHQLSYLSLRISSLKERKQTIAPNTWEPQNTGLASSERKSAAAWHTYVCHVTRQIVDAHDLLLSSPFKFTEITWYQDSRYRSEAHAPSRKEKNIYMINSLFLEIPTHT